MKNKKGFTLIEVLAVVTIIALLLGLIIPNIIEYVFSARKRVFTEDARSIVSVVKSDYSSADHKVGITTFDKDDINRLLIHELGKSAFDSDYKTAKVAVKKNSDGSYKYYVCLIDTSGYGFGYTDINEVSKKTLKVNKIENNDCGGIEGDKYTVTLNIINGTINGNESETRNVGSGTEIFDNIVGEYPNYVADCDALSTSLEKVGTQGNNFKFTVNNINSSVKCTITFSNKLYNVTFDANGGDSNIPKRVQVAKDSDMPYIDPSKKPSRSGFTFIGWYDNKNASGQPYYDENNSGVRKYDKDGDTPLYAGWKVGEIDLGSNTITSKYSETDVTKKDAINAPTGGTGNYGYTIIGGNSDDRFDLNGKDLSIKGNTPVGRYEITVKVKDKISGAENNTTYIINVIKADDKITITPKSAVYTGSPIAANAGSSKSGSSLSYKYYNSSNCSGVQLSSTPRDVGNYSVKVVSAESSNYNAGEKCVTHTITKADPVCPNITSYSEQYDGNSHTIGSSGGSGGTIEYSDDGERWSSTNYSMKNRGSETIFVRVKGDGNHNTKVCGSRILKVTRREVTVIAEDKEMVYGESVPNFTYKVTGAVAGETAVSGSANYTVKDSGGRTVTISSSSTPGTYSITPSGLTAGDNYNISFYKPGNLIIKKAVCNRPTNVAISTDGRVTWTASSNANGYQISMDNANWENATSGIDYLNKITSSTGNRTVYVRSVCDSTYYNSPSSSDFVTVSVYKLTTSSSNTNYGTVDSNTYNVISGVTYTTSYNKLYVKSGSTTLKTITAIPRNNYYFDRWSSTSGTISSNTSITASFGISSNVVSVVVVNGSIDTSSKSVDYGGSAYFTVTPRSGYENGSVTCTYGQSGSLSGNTLTVSNVTSSTTCTVTFNSSAPTTNSVKLNVYGGYCSKEGTNSVTDGNTLTSNCEPDSGYYEGSLSCSNGVYSDTTEYGSSSWWFVDTVTIGPVYSSTECNLIYSEEDVTPTYYTITANANGGSISSTTGWSGTGSTSTKTVAEGNRYGTLPNVSRNGYTFDGWYTSSTGGSRVTSSTTANSSRNIYAHWSLGCSKLSPGSYSSGQSVSYGGKSYTVVSDYGSSVGLAYNGAVGSGTYSSSSSYLNTNFIENDSNLKFAKENGCLVDQGSNTYVTSDSGISTGYTSSAYWTDSSHYYLPSGYNSYKLSSTRYVYGSEHMTGTQSGSLNYSNINTSYTSTAISAGIKSTSSNGPSITLQNATLSSKTTNYYYSRYETELNFAKSCGDWSANSTRVCFDYSLSEVGGNTIKSGTSDANVYSASVTTCGGPAHNAYAEVSAYSTDYFTFVYGSTNSEISYNAARKVLNTAGRYASISKSSIHVNADSGGTYTRYIWSFDTENSTYCTKLTYYELGSKSVNLDYRPYIIVKEG